MTFELNFPPIKSSLLSHSDRNHTLIIGPLMPGYGYTLGNSLRRIFLSSIPGYAVTRISINDVTHEYQTIPGVVEDAFDIVLNLKQLRVNVLNGEDKALLTLRKNSAGQITARDFEKEGKVEIVNPDLYIATLDKNTTFELEVEVTRGVGYVPLETNKLVSNTDPKNIYVDAMYTPVSNVALNVDQVRVGDKTNFDELQLSFETDGSVEAKEVVEFALQLNVDLAQKMHSAFQAASDLAPHITSEKVSAPESDVVAASNEEVDLPKRIKGILEKNDITTNSQLKARLSEVEEFAGITEKAMETIREYLNSLS